MYLSASALGGIKGQMRMYIWLYSQHTNTKLTCLWTGKIGAVTEIRTEDSGKGQRSPTAVTLHINTSRCEDDSDRTRWSPGAQVQEERESLSSDGSTLQQRQAWRQLVMGRPTHFLKLALWTVCVNKPVQKNVSTVLLSHQQCVKPYVGKKNKIIIIT